MSKTDTELWREVLSGDASAWREIVKRYQALVYAVSSRSGLSASDAADCFQQTWVTLYENRRKIENPSRLSAWLVTTARREAMRLRRQAERSGGEVGEDDLVDNNPLPDEELTILERQAQLEIAIKELDERCRRLIELFFFAPEEKTYEEIASILGMAANSLGASRRRCLIRLREILVRNGHLDVRNDTF
jgi:RNA polymerase sigma factor (sigma-70 family)